MSYEKKTRILHNAPTLPATSSHRVGERIQLAHEKTMSLIGNHWNKLSVLEHAFEQLVQILEQYYIGITQEIYEIEDDAEIILIPARNPTLRIYVKEANPAFYSKGIQRVIQIGMYTMYRQAPWQLQYAIEMGNNAYPIALIYPDHEYRTLFPNYTIPHDKISIHKASRNLAQSIHQTYIPLAMRGASFERGDAITGKTIEALLKTNHYKTNK